MQYKGYTAQLAYGPKDKLYYGIIADIDDFVDFSSPTEAGLQEEFESAVDDYLAYCDKVGKRADAPENRRA